MSGEYESEREEQEPDAEDITQILNILSDENRRKACYFLIEETGGVVNVEDLAIYLLSGDVDPSSDNLDDLMLELYHSHLPKMDEAGVIDYDEKESTVQYQGDEILEDVLSVVAVHDLAE